MIIFFADSSLLKLLGSQGYASDSCLRSAKNLYLFKGYSIARVLKCLDITKFSIKFRNIFSFDKATSAGIAIVLASIFNDVKRKKKLKFVEVICVQALTYQYFLISGFLLICLSVQAQHPHPAWRNYTTDQGLPSSEIHCMLQDSKGYMWFGTDNGLSRFNGYGFRNFGVQDGLKNIVVFYLQEDHKGRIWLATLSHNIYYVLKDSIYPYEHNDIIQGHKREYDQYGGDFYTDQSGNLYTTLQGLGILKIDSLGNDTLYKSQVNGGQLMLDIDGKLLSQVTISDMDTWNKYTKGGRSEAQQTLELLKDGEKQVIYGFNHWANPGQGLIHQLDNDRYLIRRGKGFYLLEHQKVSLLFEMDSGLGNNKTFAKGAEGSFLFGLQGGGGLRHYQHLDRLKKNDYQVTLQGHSITGVLQGNDGELWVSTLQHGVFYSPNPDFEIYDISTGLNDDPVIAIAVKDTQSVFAGFLDGTIVQLNRTESTIDQLPDYEGKGYINNLLFDPAKETLINSSRYIHIYQEGKWRPVLFQTKNGENRRAIGQNIFKDDDNSKLWTTSPVGFLIYNLDTLTRKYHSRNQVNFNERTRAIFKDHQNRIWIGALSGLYQYKQDTLLQPTNPHPGLQARIETIGQLKDSTLILGTKGLGILLWKGDEISQITTREGLTSDMIETLHVDENDNIWVGTLAGLNKVRQFSPGSATVQPFTLHHGMPSNEIHEIQSLGNHIWVATHGGLVHFLDDPKKDTVSVPPRIERIQLNGKDLASDDSNIFAYHENDIVFEYLTINYPQIGQVPYQVRLLPQQSNWVATKQLKINYPALKAGMYTFEVRSQNKDGLWSPTTAYQFEIRPPFWKTWTFFFSMVLLFSFLGYRWYKFRTGQLKREAEVVRQLTDLERSALRAQMNPHFIFNCLNSISNFINKGEKKAANQYLTVFARLIRSTLYHSRSKRINLEDELEYLHNYLAMEQLRFKDQFEYQIELSEEVKPFEIDIPPMMIQPFVENAIIHGLAKKEGKGKIDIKYTLLNGLLQVAITDNGIGIETSKRQKSTQHTLHKSIGMNIARKRLEMLDGHQGIGALQTSEIKGVDGLVKGTVVTVQIPI